MSDNPENRQVDPEWPAWRIQLHNIIFEADTPAGKLFDIILLILIVLSILVVMLETVPQYDAKHHSQLVRLEWILTILFTIEYILRLISVKKPWKYVTSFYGIIDLLSILPTYLSYFFPRTRSFMVIRALRLMRVFRVLKLGRYNNASLAIIRAIKASTYKITVFLIFIVISVTIIGSVMYYIENPSNPSFSSIPMSIYWAIVTLTTVGFGDITPITPLGKFLSSLIMIIGYGVLAVPTGIVSAEMVSSSQKKGAENFDHITKACINCGAEIHSPNSKYCDQCGHDLSHNSL